MATVVGPVIVKVTEENWAAIAMRNLDEDDRDRLIEAGSPVVVDAREYFERRSLDGKEVTMPFPWFGGDDIA